MSAANMTSHRPISPPSSNSGDAFQHGIHALIQHNATTSYPRGERYEYDEGIHLPSGPHSAYGSPPPPQQANGYGYHGQQGRYPYQQHHAQDSGLGIPYDDYNAGPYRQTHQYGSPEQYHYGTPAASPPSPSMSQDQDIITTRSGLAIRRGTTRNNSRQARSPKAKKPRKEKAKAEKKVAKLVKPLSELTKDWTHVPVVDIEAYVNRSADVRRKEVEDGKVPGKVKRPMNSFMLYRKAYQNRTKDWCLQNNHQVVSQVCGDSWPLEPEEIREQFNEWAKVERANHQNAHPGYKFSPSKAGTKVTAKRKFSEDIDTEDSELDDFDWARGQTRKRRPRHDSRGDSPYHGANSPYNGSTPYTYSRDASLEPGSMNRSAYHAANPGKLAPAPYNQSNLHPNQYYQQTIHQNTSVPGVEDIVIRKTDAPGMGSLGIPGGGYDFDLMNQPPSFRGTPQPQPQPEVSKIDPSLLGPDGGNALFESNNNSYVDSNGMYYENNSFNADSQWPQQYGFPEDHFEGDFGQSNSGQQIHNPDVDILKGGNEGWDVSSLNAGQEFDQWMDT